MDENEPGRQPTERSVADAPRTRRQFLATSLIGGIGLATVVGDVSGRRWAEETIVAPGTIGDYTSINDAIDEAGVGDRISVVPGTYEGTVVVDVPGVTLSSLGLAGATIQGGWTQAGPVVDIRADGVTVRGFRVTHPDGRLGITVDSGLAGVQIRQNHVTEVGPYGAPGATGIGVGTPQSSLSITGNVVENVRSVLPEETTYPVSDGITINGPPDTEDDETADDGATTRSEPPLTDSVVRDNVVRRLTSEYACRGIAVIPDAARVDVWHNDVYTLDARTDRDEPSPYAWGIHAAGRADDVQFQHNVVDDISASAYVGTGVMVRGQPDGLTITENDLTTTLGVQNDTDVPLAAALNWWGHPLGPLRASSNRATKDLRPKDGQGTYVGPMTVDPWLTGTIQSNGDRTNEYVQTRLSEESIDGGREGPGLWTFTS